MTRYKKDGCYRTSNRLPRIMTSPLKSLSV